MEILVDTKLAQLQQKYAEGQAQVNDMLRQRQELDQAIANNNTVLLRMQGAIGQLADLQKQMQEHLAPNAPKVSQPAPAEPKPLPKEA